jgi:hypothetical protein
MRRAFSGCQGIGEAVDDRCCLFVGECERRE